MLRISFRLFEKLNTDANLFRVFGNVYNTV